MASSILELWTPVSLSVVMIVFSKVVLKPAALKAKNGTVIAATVVYGKGKVFAVGDPWLYNEYVNGRLPAAYQNDKAAADLARWLLAQVAAKHKH